MSKKYPFLEALFSKGVSLFTLSYLEVYFFLYFKTNNGGFNISLFASRFQKGI